MKKQLNQSVNFLFPDAGDFDASNIPQKKKGIRLILLSMLLIVLIGIAGFFLFVRYANSPLQDSPETVLTKEAMPVCADPNCTIAQAHSHSSAEIIISREPCIDVSCTDPNHQH